MSNSLLSVDEALAAVAAAQIAAPETETLGLDTAPGRVLAQDVVADRDQPPFARSTRDGYATRAGGPANLSVAGQVRAGTVWQGPAVEVGDCLEIMTGAPVPPGFDAVVMLEHVTRENDAIRIREDKLPQAGENVVAAGSEARAGDVLLQAGARLGAAEIALAASVGAVELTVFRRPRVAIVATGDELVDAAQTPLPHQIRNSNSYGIAALVQACGAEPVVLPIVADTFAAVDAAIHNARRCDLIVMSGGVSAGKFDFVKEALDTHGANYLFTGVRMQPGKPVVFAEIPPDVQPHRYVFGLPGNPVSTQVTFLLFVAPLLHRMCGEVATAPRFAMARLGAEVRVKTGLTRFLPAVMQSDLHGTVVRLVGWQGSGDLHANARANCYLVVPPDHEMLATGEMVSVLLR